MKKRSLFFKKSNWILTLILVNILVLNTTISAQRKMVFKANTSVCAIDDNPKTDAYYVTEASKEVIDVVKEICRTTGTDPNKIIIEAGDVPKAQAFMQNGKRFIHYNPLYINEIQKQSQSYWAMIFVLAHEIGHHFNGDLFNTTDEETIKKEELAADKVAGCTLARLGATREELQKAMSKLKEKGDATHPERSARLLFALRGFDDCSSKATTLPESSRQTTLDPNSDCFKKNTGNVFFQNSTRYKIRVSRTINSIWLDTQQMVEILPTETNGLFKLPAEYSTFTVEAWSNGGWQKYKTINRKIQKCEEDPPPVEIK